MDPDGDEDKAGTIVVTVAVVPVTEDKGVEVVAAAVRDVASG